MLRADNVTLFNTTFLDNEAKQGGALCFVGTKFYFFNNTSERNVATSIGGALYFMGSTGILIHSSLFNSNSGGQSGGSIYFSSANEIRIQNTEFNYGTAGSSGAGLYLTQSKGLILREVKFHRNEASSLGGAIFMDGGGSVNYDNVNSTKNQAAYGGVLYIDSAQNVSINGSIFNGNVASSNDPSVFASGSSIWAAKTSDFTIYHNWFDSNVATTGCGTVYWEYNGGGMEEPKGLRSSNLFAQNNQAKYGPKW